MHIRTFVTEIKKHIFTLPEEHTTGFSDAQVMLS